MRDEFSRKTKEDLARRVAYLCSNPKCKKHTIGPKITSGEGSISIGVAAHITAASIGGPRYNALLSAGERQSASNGIWLCQTCSKLIDTDTIYFTEELLREWKRTAVERAFTAIATASDSLGRLGKRDIDFDETDWEFIRGLRLPTHDDIAAVTTRLRVAAKADIQAFKGVREWPSHSIPLNLRTKDSSGIQAVTAVGVAAAFEVVSEISFVSGPGTGKTTTLVQVADSILSSDTVIAVFVPLAEWSSRNDSIFQSLTQRDAFQGFSEQHFKLTAFYGRLVLLLDGWNELDPTSRRRAIYELNALRRDYPQLGFAVSTRCEALDVPVVGPTIEIEALSDQQQLEIAQALRGKDGEKLLDQAWRTPGVREMISIPLYLNSLLAYATSGTMPTTKEEVLRLFVTEHESSPNKAEVLQQELYGVHRDLLEALAVEATRAANTTIQDSRARTIISQTENRLVEEGQITSKPQPATVLDVLINQHTLIRSGRNAGVSFQHQQFQEWYASFEVERLMLYAEAGDDEASKRLAFDIINMPAWEEPILFACDRLSRANQAGSRAVATAVLRTLSIDPMLASEMIYRASSEVWDIAKDDIVDFVGRWHTPDKIGRAIGFMITTGQPEFEHYIWPLITDSDPQVFLSAFRVAHRFKSSVLGLNVQARIAGLPEQIREHVIEGIASESGIDGIELATNLAKEDPSATVQFAVIESLLFRRADRFVTEMLKVAKDGVWPLLARKGYAGEIKDPEVAERLRRERKSYVEDEPNVLTKISLLLEGNGKSSEIAQQVATFIESESFPIKDEQAMWILDRALEYYPQEVGAALLNRIEARRELPFRCVELLKDVTSVDEGAISGFVLDVSTENRLADKAAVIVGPKTVSILIDKFLALNELRGMEMPVDKKISDEYYRLKGRISMSRTEAFLLAFQSHSDTEVPNRISALADLLACHGKDSYMPRSSLLAESHLLEPIIVAIKRWIDVMLASPEATRHQFADVVRAIERLSRPEFVDGLNRLLGEDLSRWHRARQDFSAEPKRRPILPDVTYSYTLQYQRAFAAIGDEQVVRLMEQYLRDLTFGFEAACVLKDIWNKHQNVHEEKWFRPWPDFSDVTTRRQQRQEQRSGETSSYAEIIFDVINKMALSASSKDEHQHVLKLAQIALSMPYGNKDAVLKALLALPLPILEKHKLLISMVMAGETISSDMVLDGIRDLLEEAKQKKWLLDGQDNLIEQWLVLLPFSDNSIAIHDALALIETRFREPRCLQKLLSALGNSPGTQAEELLTELADRDPRFYKEHEWLAALVARGTETSALILLDLICKGALTGSRNSDQWKLAKDLASLVRKHAPIRDELTRRYEGLTSGAGRSVIAQALVELADVEGFLTLVKGYAAEGRPFDGTLDIMIREVALRKQPLEHWKGAYELHSIDVSRLRKQLFAMLTGSAAEASVAKACLIKIDELRDEYGRIDSEPRHPDITSGLPWPLVEEQSEQKG